MLYIDALRGKDSVGIAAVGVQGKALVRKRALSVEDFLSMKPVEEVFRAKLRCLIGHNRSATKGSVNNYNAHPFSFSHITGAHNGTLTNMRLLSDHEMFDVDSEAIFHNINDHGVQHTADRLHGAWALTWWDETDHSLHMWRNEERPLFYVWSEDRKVIAWASEPWMITGVLARKGIKHTELYTVTPHHEYKFVVPLTGAEPISEIRIQPVQAYIPPVTNYQSGGRWNSQKGAWENLPEKKTLALVTNTTTTKGTTIKERVTGTKIRFTIDQILGKTATAFSLEPDVSDTNDVVIYQPTNQTRKLFQENPYSQFIGTIQHLVKKNDKLDHYAVQGNSVRVVKELHQGNDDIPLETISIGGKFYTKDEFKLHYGKCTCNQCGMELEFVEGHVATEEWSRIYKSMMEEITCADCADTNATLLH